MKNDNFIVLEGLNQKNRFYTTNIPDKDQTRLIDGSEAYKILGYANTHNEALDLINFAKYDESREIEEE